MASSTSRVFPTPASPPTSRNWPSPVAAPVIAAAIRSSSPDRPMKSGLETLIATNGLSVAESSRRGRDGGEVHADPACDPGDAIPELLPATVDDRVAGLFEPHRPQELGAGRLAAQVGDPLPCLFVGPMTAVHVTPRVPFDEDSVVLKGRRPHLEKSR